MANEDVRVDADRKKYTFENWYKRMYQDGIIGEIFDFDNIIQFRQKGNGYYVQVKEDLDLTLFGDKVREFISKNNELKARGYNPFRLSGDADYPVLDDCGKKKPEMHMFTNFSLVPVTGGLNDIKGRKPLPEFIKEIDKYYDSKNLPYRRMGRKFDDPKKNDEVEKLEKEALTAFFNIFENLDEYCRSLYFLSKEEIENKSIEDYWTARKEKALKLKIKEDILSLDISNEKYK